MNPFPYLVLLALIGLVWYILNYIRKERADTVDWKLTTKAEQERKMHQSLEMLPKTDTLDRDRELLEKLWALPEVPEPTRRKP